MLSFHLRVSRFELNELPIVSQCGNSNAKWVNLPAYSLRMPIKWVEFSASYDGLIDSIFLPNHPSFPPTEPMQVVHKRKTMMFSSFFGHVIFNRRGSGSLWGALGKFRPVISDFAIFTASVLLGHLDIYCCSRFLKTIENVDNSR